ncbi:MAG: ABC transporter ATP-binding protein [Christensenellaceae bacterium]|nr:ABC transporter ATP-binding protein [Christensenellaceae bacterium]
MAGKEERIPLREAIRLHKRAFLMLHGYCPGFFLFIALKAVASSVIPYVTVFFSARIIDELAGLRRPDALWQWVLATLLTDAALGLLSAVLGKQVNARSELYNWRSIHQCFTEHFLTMDYANMETRETNDQYAQIMQNMQWGGLGLPRVRSIFEALVRAVIGILGALALTAGLLMTRVPESAGVLTALDHPAALIALLLIITAMVTAAPLLSARVGFYTQSEAMADKARKGNRIFSAYGFLAGDQHRALDIRMYRQEKLARHYMSSDKVFGKDGAMARLCRGKAGVLESTSASLSSLMTGVVYAYVCLKAWSGAFGVGAVTQYVSAVTALAGSATGLFEQLAGMLSNAPFLKLTFDFLDQPNAMYQGSLTTEKRADRQYDVEFRDVSFRYPGSERYALRHTSVKFKVGQRLAVVGENGSGKTTFIKLLCRLYDPEDGQILLNGIDIRKYDPKDYRQVFSVVFQDFQLLSQPLGANVAGCAHYDRERALNSLQDAGFANRLKEMPEDLDTQLYRDFGEEGVNVSGGEAQKIAIARALYKDAPFIVLDEPTAALDPMAEAEIYAQFSQISGDRTAIYISHRLSSCRFCDEILVFDEGRVVQRGDHDSLLRDQSGKYYQLWHAQAQYYAQQ